MQDNQLTVSAEDPLAALKWHIDVGADEAVGEEALDRTLTRAEAERPVTPVAVLRPAVLSSSLPNTELRGKDQAIAAEMTADAQKLAESCQTLDDLEQALRNFDACPLKRTATNTVFADGNPKARLMVVGEAPGADEDRLGRPFAGEAGHLLDKMLAAIGHSRENTYITNVINWRPPGNRDPSEDEIAMCLPFIRRHIELVNPEVLFCIGGVSANTLLEKRQGIARIRGRWADYKSPGLQRPISCIASFHPSYLLRSPAHKALAWNDLLSIKARLSGVSA